MKKIIAISFALLMTLAVVVPMVQATQTITWDGSSKDYDMSASLPDGGGGTGTAPTILCVWELDDDTGDADPVLDGTQVDPPLEYDGQVDVHFFAVVMDPDTSDWDDPAQNDINMMSVDVFHPNAHLEDGYKYGINEPFLGVPGACEHSSPRLKFDLVLELESMVDSLDDLEWADGLNDIICYFDAYSYSQVYQLIANGQARVYYNVWHLTYCQPAGYYPCNFKALDKASKTDTLLNAFEYVLGVGIETDFASLDFGQCIVGQTNWIYGDWIWGSGDPTVRNIGNWDVKIQLEFDDFGQGQSVFDGEMQWNIVYDARLGNWPGAPRANDSYAEEQAGGAPIGYEEYIHPDTPVILPCQWYRVYEGAEECANGVDVLRKCNTSKISFAIKIRKDLGFTGDLPDGDDDLTITIFDPYSFDRTHANDLPCWTCHCGDPAICE